jgi:hypothetical protein
MIATWKLRPAYCSIHRALAWASSKGLVRQRLRCYDVFLVHPEVDLCSIGKVLKPVNWVIFPDLETVGINPGWVDRSLTSRHPESY